MHDGRRELPSSDLDTEGFRLVEQETEVADFYDDKQISSTYHGEVADLLIKETGARRVEIFDDTRRTSSVDLQKVHQIREPANIVHNDYTERSGAKRLNDLFPDEAEELSQHRFAIINVWRSIAGPILDHPLVLCDATTVEPHELVAVERRAEERIGELQVATFGDRQRWYYFPQMQMNEALIFKTLTLQPMEERDSPYIPAATTLPHQTMRHPAKASRLVAWSSSKPNICSEHFQNDSRRSFHWKSSKQARHT